MRKIHPVFLYESAKIKSLYENRGLFIANYYRLCHEIGVTKLKLSVYNNSRFRAVGFLRKMNSSIEGSLNLFHFCFPSFFQNLIISKFMMIIGPKKLCQKKENE